MPCHYCQQVFLVKELALFIHECHPVRITVMGYAKVGPGGFHSVHQITQFLSRGFGCPAWKCAVGLGIQGYDPAAQFP